MTKLNCTISSKVLGSALAYECESCLLKFHWSKQVTCPSLSGMGKTPRLLGVAAIHMAMTGRIILLQGKEQIAGNNDTVAHNFLKSGRLQGTAEYLTNDSFR